MTETEQTKVPTLPPKEELMTWAMNTVIPSLIAKVESIDAKLAWIQSALRDINVRLK